MVSESGNKVQGRICVAIAEKSIEEALATAKKAEVDADVIEIRLDALEKATITPFVEGLSKPLLFTNRASWEGGAFEGSEEDRIAVLLKAVESKAAYVDIELRAEDRFREQLIAAAKKSGTKIIVSWHDFKETPTTQELISIFQMQYRTGADIGKISTMANTHYDVLRVLDLQIRSSELDFPLISFCMGRMGAISRIATVELGGYMTYAAPDNGKQTAPGQMPVSIMKSILQNFDHAN